MLPTYTEMSPAQIAIAAGLKFPLGIAVGFSVAQLINMF